MQAMFDGRVIIGNNPRLIEFGNSLGQSPMFSNSGLIQIQTWSVLNIGRVEAPQMDAAALAAITRIENAQARANAARIWELSKAVNAGRIAPAEMAVFYPGIASIGGRGDSPTAPSLTSLPNSSVRVLAFEYNIMQEINSLP